MTATTTHSHRPPRHAVARAAASLADRLDLLARTATDWRHDAELRAGLAGALDDLHLLALGELPQVDPPVTAARHAAADWYASAPDDAPPLRHDVAWSPSFVEIVPPARVTHLDDWGPAAAGPTAVGPLAVTAPFRVLSDAGLAHLQAIAGDLEAEATDFAGRRVPRHSRGAIYRSRFLQGMHTDLQILDLLSSLAGIRLEPHPNGHHASHFNFAPRDLAKAVDAWHTDVTAFDCILHVFDIDGMHGGAFEYFDGPAEEGRDLLLAGHGLPDDRVVRPEFPGAGWMVLQQGNRVLHRAAALLAPWRRCTYVPSYMAHHARVEDPDVLGTLVAIDGPRVAPVAYARHRLVVAARRLREAGSDPAALRSAASSRHDDLVAVLDGLHDPTVAGFVDYG